MLLLPPPLLFLLPEPQQQTANKHKHRIWVSGGCSGNGRRIVPDWNVVFHVQRFFISSAIVCLVNGLRGERAFKAQENV
ncbi:Hypothetical protein, putative [Bodo saltans]|uniref:Uncharacterized protein n=1 Tax=Bodo saltans TaxID=75058 RepID=A0A0S4JHL0_BODSA|nr:Hypothetical protein, putative [Bodo saltans]|eukprot:CUG89840.1 Hypothetical protein, putative [Bodo saltans]